MMRDSLYVFSALGPSHSFILTPLQWLEDDFLGYLKEWEESVSAQADLSDSERARMLLSRETIEGLHITGYKNAQV